MRSIPKLDPSSLPAVREYFRGINDTIGARFAIGVYGDGVVCADLLDTRLCRYTWLSASRAFPGSRSFFASRRFSLAQDPKIDQDFCGLSVDFNETTGDFGAFSITSSPTATPAPVSMVHDFQLSNTASLDHPAFFSAAHRETSATFVDKIARASEPVIDLALLISSFNQLQRRGVRYVYGGKAEDRSVNPRSTGRLSTPLDTIDGLDCSGFFRYILYQATNGSWDVPDGSQSELQWFIGAEQRGELTAVAPYSTVNTGTERPALFASFIKPYVNGCGAIGHVWFVLEPGDGSDAQTLECHGGGGVDARRWNAVPLASEVFQTYRLPISTGPGV